MQNHCQGRIGVRMLAVVAALMLAASSWLENRVWAEPAKSDAGPSARAARARSKDGEAVELFQAMEAGDVKVQLIPKNAKQATVIIRNQANRPLRIKLPEAFAGVPVLAQAGIGDGGGRGGRFNDGGNGGAAQSFGGGMGMGGMGMGGMGMMGGGFFNVPPDDVRKIKVQTVCLEHGKPDPNPRLPYALIPIESYTDNQNVIQLCVMLGRGEIDQQAAQAAAWHLTDGLSWQELAQKVKIRHLNGTTELYFSQRDLFRALRALDEVQRQLAEPSKTRSHEESRYTDRHAYASAEDNVPQ